MALQERTIHPIRTVEPEPVAKLVENEVLLSFLPELHQQAWEVKMHEVIEETQELTGELPYTRFKTTPETQEPQSMPYMVRVPGKKVFI